MRTDITNGNEINNARLEYIKYLILKPANQRTIKPLTAINIEVPRSGWLTTNNIGKIKIVIDNNIFFKLFIFVNCSRWKNLAKQIIIAIFINSEGCKLIKCKFIHLWDPEAVTPYSDAQIKKPKTII